MDKSERKQRKLAAERAERLRKANTIWDQARRDAENAGWDWLDLSSQDRQWFFDQVRDGFPDEDR